MDLRYVGYLLRDSAREIDRLRAENERLFEKVSLTERILALFEARPAGQNVAMSEDITYLLRKEAEFIAPQTMPSEPQQVPQ